MANGGSVSVDPRTYYQYQYPSLLNQICYWIYSASARLRRLRPLRSSTRLRPSTMAAEESKAQKAASAGGGKGKKKVLTNLPTLPARFSAPAPAARCACCRLPREPPARGWTSGRRTRGSGGVLAGSLAGARASRRLSTRSPARGVALWWLPAATPAAAARGAALLRLQWALIRRAHGGCRRGRPPLQRRLYVGCCRLPPLTQRDFGGCRSCWGGGRCSLAPD